MKNKRSISAVFFLLSATVILPAFRKAPSNSKSGYHFPYKGAGLTERQAAAHLLSRFSYGATPGQVDEVVKTGLENWFAQQLEGKLEDDKVTVMLEDYKSLNMSNEEVIAHYPVKLKVLYSAIADGVINKDSLSKFPDENFKKYKQVLIDYMREKGLRPQAEQSQELIIQKILRAAYSRNQLKEVLTGFWFNHFNITLGRADCARFATGYEQQAIRPNVLGRFEDLLLATAKSPAMLIYLDNAKSIVNSDEMTPMQKLQQQRRNEKLELRMMDMDSAKADKLKKNKRTGLNENYAREVMELHTMGVDGGYTQEDVTQAAKALTGWTMYSIKDYGGQDVKSTMDKLGKDRYLKLGYVHDSDFVFLPNRHDKTEKTILGSNFPAGGGYDEGVRLLHILSHHPSTVKFICTKLAIRFVNDAPPTSLVEKMAKTFTEKDGDISQVLIAMVSAPEFWAKESIREKTKSPFELVISSVRSLNADISQPYELFNWLTKMGEKIYYYQPPTGFPDQGQYWINTGSLLSRMNFGLALASQRIPGISINLLALNNNHEPESPEAALVTYSKLLMPERNMDATIQRLKPFLNDPELLKKLQEAAKQNAVPQPVKMKETSQDEMMMDDNGSMMAKKNGFGKVKNPKNENITLEKMTRGKGDNSMLAQVVGVILGSPEFQRR